MEQLSFRDVVDLIRKDDPRYAKRAYFFLREALDYTVKKIRKAEREAGRRRASSHVTGQELLEGIRDYALRQYGPMAYLLLREWGINRCMDFGEMVYQLIDYGVFSKTESDRKEDFADIYTFEDAFLKPFEPKNKSRVAELLRETVESN